MVSKMISNSAVKEFFAEHGILYKKQEKKKRLRTAGTEFKWLWLSMLLLACCHLNIVWHC